MATSATISSQFTIFAALSGTGPITLTNPGRSFRVINVMVFSAVGGGHTVTLANSATGNILNAASAGGANTWKDLGPLIPGGQEVADNQNLVLTTSNAQIVYALIECVAAGGGQVLITAPT